MQIFLARKVCEKAKSNTGIFPEILDIKSKLCPKMVHASLYNQMSLSIFQNISVFSTFTHDKFRAEIFGKAN